jgi:hypothetical protein
MVEILHRLEYNAVELSRILFGLPLGAGTTSCEALGVVVKFFNVFVMPLSRREYCLGSTPW